MPKPSLLPRTFSLRARYLLTMQEAPSEDGYVTIADGKIVSIGKKQRVEPVFDLGDVILMPGLVNAHTHLEFSDLKNPLPAGETFPEWILAVIASRRQQRATVEGHDSPEASAQVAVADGVAESIRSGVTTIGEISTVAGSHGWYQPAEIQTVLFQEVLGLSVDDIPAHVKTAREHVDTSIPGDERLSMGISPHAPYSVHYDLFGQLCQLAAKANIPCALHL
ncbi:MAG: amidohydrolase family protein, partial [Pirellulaceae bacterium]|nr:amidohydrolase family protein [Pirellulaceae bacterium]